MATTIKELLDSLSPEDRRLLSYAFEHDLSQFVVLPDGQYVGVNLDPTKQTDLNEPDMRAGVWSAGITK